MEKRELFKALRKVRVGDEILMSGEKHKVEELVYYQEEHNKWLNLVWEDEAGLEVALELEGGKLFLWKETLGIANIDVGILSNPPTIRYMGEEYQLKESGEAQTLSQTKKKETKTVTPWWVYQAVSGHKLAAKIWDDEVCFYFAEGELPASAVQV